MWKCVSVILRIFVFFFVFVTFSVHQGSLVSLVGRRQSTTDNEWIFITLCVILVPYTASFLSQIWRSSFSTGGRWKEWPHWGALALGMISSIFESSILTDLLWRILPQIPAPLVLGVLNSCLVISLLSNGKTTDLCFYAQIVLRIVFISCVIASSVLFVTTDYLIFEQSVLVFIYMIIISIIITPKFQSYIHSTKDRGEQNSALVYIVIKMLTVVIATYLKQRHPNVSDEIASIKTFFTSVVLPGDTNLWLCVSIIVSAFLCQTVLYVNMYSRRTKLNINLAIHLSSIVVSVLVLLSYLEVLKVSFLPWTEGMEKTINAIELSKNSLPVYITVGGLLLLPILLDFISNENRVCQIETHATYNSIFTLQCIVSCITFALQSGRNAKPSSKRASRRRIFICTTMYQETEIEMHRLLLSIKNISVSNLLKKENVDIESHIFVDNGASEQEIKQFGLQLLGLVESNLVSVQEQGIMLFTPYGIQLRWKLDSGMPLFIHLKDSSKVKPKKRWSQVMYMKYVLNYRTLSYNRISENLSKVSSVASLLSVDSLESFGERNKIFQNTLTVPDSKNGTLNQNNNIHNPTIDKTSTPYVEIFVGDTSSVENLSVKQETANSIITTTNTNDRFPDDIYLDTDEYILATDADMTFIDSSIMDVLHMCESDKDVGGVCGRTRPKGVHIHPIVWLQMFDYAKDFWLIKSSQNIIGSVMCCPGCFSMYKLEAVRDVIDEYSGSVDNMEDIFTKDNGEDRWMCTLMMLKGWKLRYSSSARNTTFCPEDTAEFMKQRRRWLLSDYANAILVVRKLKELLRKNDAFSVLYIFYLLQLFLIMLLYPGSTIVMLCLGLELATGAPLMIVTPVIVVVILAYSLVLLSNYRFAVQLVITKTLIIICGAGAVYIFVATSYIIFKDLAIGFQNGHFEHAEGFLVMIVIGGYVYGAMLYPGDIWILATGVVYLFFIPFMNMILPLYAVCNIVDQSWGTRDNQKAAVPKFLQLPKIKRRMKKKIKQQVETTSLHSLSASSLSLNNFNQSEFEFWEDLVTSVIGSDLYSGITAEEKTIGLKKLRKKALLFFMVSNLLVIIVLAGFYAFLLQTLDSKSTFSILMGVALGLSPLIQIGGSTVYRIDDILTRIGRWIAP